MNTPVEKAKEALTALTSAVTNMKARHQAANNMATNAQAQISAMQERAVAAETALAALTREVSIQAGLLNNS